MSITKSTPRHVAIIMDGNGRWAKQKSLPRLAGHNAGAKAVERVINAAQKYGVDVLSFYAFSTENWSRPQEEIDGLMRLLEQTLDKYAQTAQKNNLRLLVSGRKEPLSPAIQEKIARVTQATAQKTGLTVNLALNYGSRAELLDAFAQLASQGITKPTEQDLQRCLYQPALPDPDLLIRTSGEKRLSNFLLWQCAYTEFYFTDTLWPDFSEQDFKNALDEYARRTRRFGGI
ncbi:polyprenyl diphosphate synthase [Candidatus Avelusimicrobium aviculae]|uniref:polyprenyl diphosphate synthase n=1 Tax=Candidatus Avelusimicrobium aviculae TaxID=3416206 RepID=UPI003D0B035A